MLRLSEAIRLGAMMLPEVRGPIFDRKDNRICAACAIGSALYAVGTADDRERWLTRSGSVEELICFWPWTNERRMDPVRGVNFRIDSIIIDLFETAHWTREQIADWVETIEPREVEETKLVEITVPVTCRTVA